MLFQNLHHLATKGVAITLKVTDAGAGKLEVNVFPDAGKSGTPLLAKSFVATPTELDADFASVISEYCTVNGTLKEQLEGIQEQAAAAVAQAKDKSAAASNKSKPGKSTPALQEEEPAEGGEGNASPGPAGESQQVPFTL
ncbi:MAG: PRTRC system protein E [Gammaproteobacteria bacterium]|jgi:PRTRC genetic system protein E|uniref:PRTRC system protein E n=1 Tax=Acidovorax sp. 94 TaxID=2135633 RepID=UPI000962E811|nr:PRTRC system protein E [Acidovorax sp. 94]OJV63625.1 MAG: hypothetical protein BGO35_04355 [Burkholderiales bacterium 64-34]RKR52804.1 PRTRC genetic system protein E [Acidovorax sp. 94]